MYKPTKQHHSALSLLRLPTINRLGNASLALVTAAGMFSASARKTLAQSQQSTAATRTEIPKTMDLSKVGDIASLLAPRTPIDPRQAVFESVMEERIKAMKRIDIVIPMAAILSSPAAFSSGAVAELNQLNAVSAAATFLGSDPVGAWIKLNPPDREILIDLIKYPSFLYSTFDPTSLIGAFRKGSAFLGKIDPALTVAGRSTGAGLILESTLDLTEAGYAWKSALEKKRYDDFVNDAWVKNTLTPHIRPIAGAIYRILTTDTLDQYPELKTALSSMVLSLGIDLRTMSDSDLLGKVGEGEFRSTLLANDAAAAKNLDKIIKAFDEMNGRLDKFEERLNAMELSIKDVKLLIEKIPTIMADAAVERLRSAALREGTDKPNDSDLRRLLNGESASNPEARRIEFRYALSEARATVNMLGLILNQAGVDGAKDLVTAAQVIFDSAEIFDKLGNFYELGGAQSEDAMKAVAAGSALGPVGAVAAVAAICFKIMSEQEAQRREAAYREAQMEALQAISRQLSTLTEITISGFGALSRQVEALARDLIQYTELQQTANKEAALRGESIQSRLAELDSFVAQGLHAIQRTLASQTDNTMLRDRRLLLDRIANQKTLSSENAFITLSDFRSFAIGKNELARNIGASDEAVTGANIAFSWYNVDDILRRSPLEILGLLDRIAQIEGAPHFDKLHDAPHPVLWALSTEAYLLMRIYEKEKVATAWEDIGLTAIEEAGERANTLYHNLGRPDVLNTFVNAYQLKVQSLFEEIARREQEAFLRLKYPSNNLSEILGERPLDIAVRVGLVRVVHEPISVQPIRLGSGLLTSDGLVCRTDYYAEVLRGKERGSRIHLGRYEGTISKDLFNQWNLRDQLKEKNLGELYRSATNSSPTNVLALGQVWWRAFEYGMQTNGLPNPTKPAFSFRLPPNPLGHPDISEIEVKLSDTKDNFGVPADEALRSIIREDVRDVRSLAFQASRVLAREGTEANPALTLSAKQIDNRLKFLDFLFRFTRAQERFSDAVDRFFYADQSVPNSFRIESYLVGALPLTIPSIREKFPGWEDLSNLAGLSILKQAMREEGNFEKLLLLGEGDANQLVLFLEAIETGDELAKNPEIERVLTSQRSTWPPKERAALSAQIEQIANALVITAPTTGVDGCREASKSGLQLFLHLLTPRQIEIIAKNGLNNESYLAALAAREHDSPLQQTRLKVMRLIEQLHQTVARFHETSGENAVESGIEGLLVQGLLKYKEQNLESEASAAIEQLMNVRELGASRKAIQSIAAAAAKQLDPKSEWFAGHFKRVLEISARLAPFIGKGDEKDPIELEAAESMLGFALLPMEQAKVSELSTSLAEIGFVNPERAGQALAKVFQLLGPEQRKRTLPLVDGTLRQIRAFKRISEPHAKDSKSR